MQTNKFRVGDILVSFGGNTERTGVIKHVHPDCICVKRFDGQVGGGCPEYGFGKLWLFRYWEYNHIQFKSGISELTDIARASKEPLDDVLIDFGKLKTFRV